MKWLLICLAVFLIAGYHGHRSHAEAQPVEDKSPPLLVANSDQKSFWENINTHWGGRLKTTGTVSRVTDDTVFEPVGTGIYNDGSANFRLKNETFFTDSVYSEVHYELLWAGGDLIRKQNELKEAFPNIPDNFFFAGTALNDDRRLMDLTGTIKEKDSWFLLQRLDRLYLALLGDRGSVRIGRQAITWGNGFIFNPMDLFNPFPPTAVDRDYKVGDDMVNAQFSLAQLGDVQLLYVARRNPNSNKVSVDQASAAGKLHFAVGTCEFDILGSRHFEDNVIGIGSRGYLGNTAWRLDGTWTFLNDGENYISLVANMDYSWVWFKKNFYGFIEYYFNGLGKDDYIDSLLDVNTAERLARGELFVLGRNYLSGSIQIELHPLFSVFLTSINNIEDPSGILQPYATWDITQNLQLTGGVNVSYGADDTEFGGFTLPGTGLRTRSPDSVYLWLTYYF